MSVAALSLMFALGVLFGIGFVGTVAMLAGAWLALKLKTFFGL
jgi:hypothetical protein